jgi:ATP-binding cassette subfamily C (CFTR/MRP) protein 1
MLIVNRIQKLKITKLNFICLWVNGYVGLRGSVAYCPQQAWMVNGTLRENIVFDPDVDGGQDAAKNVNAGNSRNSAAAAIFDPDLYDLVVEACALRADFANLPAGDQTEVGEKVLFLICFAILIIY